MKIMHKKRVATKYIQLFICLTIFSFGCKDHPIKKIDSI